MGYKFIYKSVYIREIYTHKNNNSVIIAMTRDIQGVKKYISGHLNSLRVLREDFLEKAIFFFFKAETQG